MDATWPQGEKGTARGFNGRACHREALVGAAGRAGRAGQGGHRSIVRERSATRAHGRIAGLSPAPSLARGRVWLVGLHPGWVAMDRSSATIVVVFFFFFFSFLRAPHQYRSSR